METLDMLKINEVRTLTGAHSHYVDRLEGSASPDVCVPSDDRMVVIYGLMRGELLIVGARYRLGRWIGGASGNDLTDDINTCEQVVWSESYLLPPSAMGMFRNF